MFYLKWYDYDLQTNLYFLSTELHDAMSNIKKYDTIPLFCCAAANIRLLDLRDRTHPRPVDRRICLIVIFSCKMILIQFWCRREWYWYWYWYLPDGDKSFSFTANGLEYVSSKSSQPSWIWLNFGLYSKIHKMKHSHKHKDNIIILWSIYWIKSNDQLECLLRKMKLFARLV